MKTLALGIALSTSLLSTGAMAADQRPGYIAFAAPRTDGGEARTPAALPQAAAPKVAKRGKALGGIPFYIPLVGAITVVGLVAALSGGGNNGSPG